MIGFDKIKWVQVLWIKTEIETMKVLSVAGVKKIIFNVLKQYDKGSCTNYVPCLPQKTNRTRNRRKIRNLGKLTNPLYLWPLVFLSPELNSWISSQAVIPPPLLPSFLSLPPFLIHGLEFSIVAQDVSFLPLFQSTVASIGCCIFIPCDVDISCACTLVRKTKEKSKLALILCFSVFVCFGLAFGSV